MADNYLEKRMDDYRNGGSGIVVRKHKMPKKKVVLVKGCSCEAHVDVIRMLCNGGHLVYVSDVSEEKSLDVAKTLARLEISPSLIFDSVVVNNGDDVDFNARIVMTQCMSDDRLIDMNCHSNAVSFNVVKYPSVEDGLRLAKVVRFLVDSEEEIMDRQVIETL